MQNPITKVYRAYDQLFINSKALVIEYNDVLRAQWFGILTCLTSTDAVKDYFDTSILAGMDSTELFEWYVMRKHQNFLMDLPCRYEFPDEETKQTVCDNFLFGIGQLNQLYGLDLTLNFHDIFTNLIGDGKGLIKHYYIYGGTQKDPLMEAQIRQDYKISADFLYGDFGKALEGINKDATYVLSDIEKVSALVDTGRIECASVLIADGFRYNFMEDESDGLKVDIDMILNAHTCRISFFNNLTQPQIVNEEGKRIDPVSGRILEVN